MSAITLNEMFNRAKEKGYAVGAFNIFNYLSARAVIPCCRRDRQRGHYADIGLDS